MKIKVLILAIMTISWSYSQKSFKKSDVYGKYKLVLNLTDVIESENDDMSLLEEIIVTSITKSIDRVSNEYVSIIFDFRNNNKIYIDDSDNDDLNVKINSGEGYWILENKNLVKYGKDGTKVNGVFLIRI